MQPLAPYTPHAPHTTCALGALAVFAAAAFAQHGPAPHWTVQFGTPAADVPRVIAPDSAGGVFLAGTTEGSLGGPNAGGSDAFLLRYDSAGNRLWARQLGGPGDEFGWALSEDGAGGAYIAGYTTSDLAGYTGWHDAFVARYDSAGNQLWVRQFGTPRSDIARAVLADGAGGFFITGSTAGDLGGEHTGATDVFLARHDSAGNRVWITQFGTELSERGRALALDGAGGVYVAGDTYGDLAGASGGLDAFLARYDSAGNRMWIRQFGSPQNDFGFAVAPDGAGGVFIGGLTGGDLGGPSAGDNDAYLARYDSAGNRVWIVQFGTPQWDEAFTLAADGAGGVFVAGGTEGHLGAPSAGASDAFLARFSGDGDRVWMTQFGTSAADGAVGAAGDAAGGVFVLGYTDGDLGGPSAGGRDGFLARFPGEFCYADCDGSGMLTLDDFLCFMDRFATGHQLPPEQQVVHYANCTRATQPPALTLDDFLCFMDEFARGCP